eukprot:m.273848 g.273848  ORF g.273848 m.273848 type:complete len:276 (+) comp16128_c0_seq1:3441-4268(+)
MPVSGSTKSCVFLRAGSMVLSVGLLLLVRWLIIRLVFRLSFHRNTITAQSALAEVKSGAAAAATVVDVSSTSSEESDDSILGLDTPSEDDESQDDLAAIDKKTGKDFFGRDARGGAKAKDTKKKKSKSKKKHKKSKRKRKYSDDESDAESEEDRSKKVRRFNRGTGKLDNEFVNPCLEEEREKRAKRKEGEAEEREEKQALRVSYTVRLHFPPTSATKSHRRPTRLRLTQSLARGYPQGVEMHVLMHQQMKIRSVQLSRNSHHCHFLKSTHRGLL